MAIEARRGAQAVGLRTVAVVEASKGAIVLLLGLGLFALIHRDLDEVAEGVTEILHVNPEGRLSNLFFMLADRTTDKTLWVLACGALAYAGVRFTEAYGLWRVREWAQWFALLSGCLYLPWEMYAVLRHHHLLNWLVLLINLAIVLYMAALRVMAARQRLRTFQ